VKDCIADANRRTDRQPDYRELPREQKDKNGNPEDYKLGRLEIVFRESVRTNDVYNRDRQGD